MRTSPSSSPTTSRKSTASASTATWTTARRIRRSVGGSPTRGCRWPATATGASPTVFRSTNGASAWKAAVRSALRSSAAAVYSSVKYLDWMKKYAPPQAQGMTFSEEGPVPAQGNIVQQIFWYTAFTADMVKPGLPVVNADGTPKWRMAPSPHGAYWKDGMKLGYQDVGSVTLLKSTPLDRRKAAWLYQQFIVSKTVSLKKSHVGLTFIRESDIWDKSFTERAPQLGGLIEFYRSPARVQWTPTGNNVPDYPKLAQLWWQNIGDASSGAKTRSEEHT